LKTGHHTSQEVEEETDKMLKVDQRKGKEHVSMPLGSPMFLYEYK